MSAEISHPEDLTLDSGESQSCSGSTSPPPLTRFGRWVGQAKPGECFEYHRGFLTVDRSPASHLADYERRVLTKLAGAALTHLRCDLSVVTGFLDCWAERDQGRHLLLSILPDTVHPQGKTFDWPADRATALHWIEACNRSTGIYWTANICRPNLMKKAQKHDVQLLRAVWADCDPLDDPELGERCRPLGSRAPAAL